MDDDIRKQFEAWITASPYEMPITRFPNDGIKYAWPDQYRHNDVSLAFDAYREGMKAAYADAIEIVQRHQYRNGWHDHEDKRICHFDIGMIQAIKERAK